MTYEFRADTTADLGPLNAVPRCKACNVDGKLADPSRTVVWQNWKRYNLTGISGHTVDEERMRQKATDSWRG